MKYPLRDIFEYIIAVVDELAQRFNLSDKEIFKYIKNHNGIAFIEQNYGIIHTLDFNEAIENIILYCRKSGGEL